jgi:hypothetical protein
MTHRQSNLNNAIEAMMRSIKGPLFEAAQEEEEEEFDFGDDQSWADPKDDKTGQLQSIFREFAGQAAKLIELSSSEDVEIIVSRMRYGGMYGSRRRIYLGSTKSTSGEGNLNVFGHELGHAYRDKFHGPIYDIYLLKDPRTGNPISAEEAAHAVSFEEQEACRLSAMWFEQIGMTTYIKNTDHGYKQYMGFLEEVRRRGIRTHDEASDFFLKMAGG